MPQFEAEFLVATTDFFDVIQGNLIATANAAAVGLAIPPNVNFNAFPAYAAAKLAYVTALTASIGEIDELQAAGVAHYNPAYLARVHVFLAGVSAGQFDTVASQPGLLQQVAAYGNLYNDGAWTNVMTYLRQREMGRYSATLLGWLRSGEDNHQALNMSLQVSYNPGPQPQLQTLQVGVYWPLSTLHDSFDDLFGNPQGFHRYDVTGPNGAVLSPGTEALIDFGLKDGDQVTATLVPIIIFGGPIIGGSGGVFGPGTIVPVTAD